MVTVLRARGLRVAIFLNDHLPAHVHVFGSGEAKINLRGADDRPELLWADGLGHREIRDALHIVTEQRDLLLKRWEEMHGRIDGPPDRSRP